MDGGFDSNVSSSEDDAKKSDFSSVESSPEADQRPQSDFLDCVKSLFDIFDSEKKGYVTIDELEKYLNNNDNPLLKTNSTSKKVNLIHTLQHICPANGYVNFKRFSLAIQIALGKRNLDKEKGIGRSLRPRSFLFAVTEVADNESGIKEDKGHGKEKRVSYSPADSVISSDLDDSLEINEITDSVTKEYQQQEKNSRNRNKYFENKRGKMAIEEFFVLQKCLLEVNKVREIYRSRIAELEKAIEEDKHIIISSNFDYSHAALHISKVLRMNEKLQVFQLPDSGNLTKDNIKEFFEPHKKIEELNFCVRQLENEKSILVKDYFSLKAKYAELEGKKTEKVLF